eukprot:COSAG01_NODE_7987_length_2963_cov_2.214036_1_plen_302_part_00
MVVVCGPAPRPPSAPLRPPRRPSCHRGAKLLPNDGGAEHYRRRPCLVTVILLLLSAARCRSVGATAQQTAAAAAGRNCSLATSVSGVGAWHGTDAGEAVCLREVRARTVCFMSLRFTSHSRVRHRSAPAAAIREHTTDTDATFLGLGHETPPHKSSHSKEHGHRHRRHSTPETAQSLLGGKRRVRRTQQPRRSRTRNHRHDGTGSIQQQRRQHSGAHAREPRPAAGIIAEGEAVIGAASYATGEGPPQAPAAAAAAAAWRAGAIDVMQVRVHGAPESMGPSDGITSRRDEQGEREESVWRC